MAVELRIPKALGLRWRHPMATRTMNLIFVLTDSMRPRRGATTLVFQNVGAGRPNPVRCDLRGNLPGPHRPATA